MTHTVLIILGPTASGKSRLALEVAKQFNGVLINADSMQVYKNFPILAANPSKAEQSQCPHKLYGIFDLEKNDLCSAAKWAILAKEEILNAFQEKRLPILVGGTGFYIKALLEGLSPIPNIPDTVRSAISSSLKDARERQKLYAYLKTHDPQTEEKLKPGDTQRLARALEVLFYTKKPLSFWKLQPKTPALNARFRIVSIMPQREHLYAAINARTECMLENGALKEVSNFAPPETSLLSSGLNSIGYKELRTHLDGELTYEAALTKIQQRTRNYAKRQGTWMRHQIKSDYVIESLIPQK